MTLKVFEKIIAFCREALQKTGVFFKELYQKAQPFCKEIFVKVKNIFGKLLENKKLTAAVAGGVVGVAAVVTVIILAVTVWSWTDVTVNLPYELYVSCTDAVSDSDQPNEFITDVALPGWASAVSDTDAVSESDVVSSSDAVSDSDVVSLSMHIKKKQTVEDILALAGIVINEAYSVDRTMDEIITEPAVITIYRMKYVTLQADGMVFSKYTDLETVGELLADQMVIVDADDRISYDIAAELFSGMIITVNRVDVLEEVRAESVPFKTEQRENSSMYKGQSEVVVEGVNGSKDVTYRLTYVDGILESTEAVSEVITVEPINEVIEIGTKKRPTTTTRKTNSGRYVVSKEKVYDCDGSGHGYYIITYSDGTVVYKDF